MAPVATPSPRLRLDLRLDLAFLLLRLGFCGIEIAGGLDSNHKLLRSGRRGRSRQQGGDKNASFISKFLATHPTDEARIADLQRLLPEAETEFSKSHVVTPTGAPAPVK